MKRFGKLLAGVALSAILFLPSVAAAHCDTVDGPVVKAAQLALNSGDITPVLRWVKPQDEAEIRAAFARALKIRTVDAEARELADTYFFETLVRVHRAGEGAPYSGLKPAGTEVAPGIALADKALETGSARALVQHVTGEIGDGIQQRFARVQETRAHADQSVEAGRAYVAAYVEFIHYVERLQNAASQSGHVQTELTAAEAQRHQD